MTTNADQTQRAIDTAIRLGVIAGVAYMCFLVLEPFILPVAWGMIIAVAVYPLHLRIAAALGDRHKAALSIFTLSALALLIVPTVLLVESILEAYQAGQAAYEAGTLRVPPPRDGVEEWPLIGERLHDVWAAASVNLTATLERFEPQVTQLTRGLLSGAAGAGMTVLHFVISILIAAALMANAEACHRVARSIGRRLAGEVGGDFVELSTATTRSVAQGVLGVALIQALAAGIGMLFVGVPAAGLWALLVLVLAIVQLPPLVILGPVIVYVFSANETLPAILFMAWGILVSISDTFLKPLLLGRGLDIPMLVILLGAIGGMVVAGVIGLFVGAVVLALSYTLLVSWLEQAPPEPDAVGE